MASVNCICPFAELFSQHHCILNYIIKKELSTLACRRDPSRHLPVAPVAPISTAFKKGGVPPTAIALYPDLDFHEVPSPQAPPLAMHATP